MAIVAAYHITPLPEWGQNNPNTAVLDDLYDALYADRRVSDIGPGSQGTMAFTAPAARGAAIQASKARGYADDYYHRVHLRPYVVDLGNLVTEKEVRVEVWNSFREDNHLASITETGDPGISFDGPIGAPTTFGQLEARDCTLTATLSGPPIIEATVVLDFSLGAPDLGVIGNRVLVWSFMPQTEHQEGLSWSTDVIDAFNAEQRIALRAAPRQEFSYTYHLDQQEFSKAKALAGRWQYRNYGVPVWSEAVLVGPLQANLTEILFDTSYLDFRDGGFALLWDGAEDFEAVEVQDVLADRLIISKPTNKAFSNALVTPLRLGWTPRGVRYKRAANDIAVTSVSFNVTDNADLGADIGLPQYRGADVYTGPLHVSGSTRERMVQPVDTFDNGSGVVGRVPSRGFLDNSKEILFDTLDRQERWEIRQWLHSLRGKQKAFWLPTWNQDFVMAEDYASGSSLLTVEPIGYPQYYDVTDIMVLLADGTQYFNRVLSASLSAYNNEILELEAAFPAPFTAAEVRLVCFIHHTRLDSDKVQIKHGFGGRATASAQTKEIPE